MTPPESPPSLPFGIVHGMPIADYLAVPAVSASGLKLFARSPWHYANRIEPDPTPAMLGGVLAHCAVLEPDAMSARFVVVPADAPTRPTERQWNAKDPSPSSVAAMQWWRRFKEETGDRAIVPAEDFALCQDQLKAVASDPELSAILREGRGEVSIFWNDPVCGLYCKARPDWLPPVIDGCITPLDLKTCADESPNAFGRAAARMRYDLQAAHYSAGIEAVTGARVARFILGAVTNKRPVLAVPYVLTDEVREQAREERAEMLERLAWCERERQWPAYGTGVQLLDFPAYAKRSGEVEIEWSEES